MAKGVSPVTYDVSACYENRGISLRVDDLQPGQVIAGANQNGITNASLPVLDAAPMYSTPDAW